MNGNLDFVLSQKIIAIVRGVYGENILRLGEALLAGGIRMIEVTFDQTGDPEETAKAIRDLSAHFSGEILPGAGTVMNEAQVRLAKEAGAAYIISPNVEEAVIRETKKLGMLSFPGALTPTEIVHAHDLGADLVKIFPVSTLGASYIKAVKAPLKHIGVMAVGGVNEENAGEFIKAGAQGVGVGGNLVNRALVEAGRFDEITKTAGKLYDNVFGGR